MAKFGKWVGAGLGWAFGGPIGAVIGLGLGWMFDTAQEVDISKGYKKTTRGDFAISLLVLIAAVMKADGKVMQSELNYVKSFFIQKFGTASANEALRMLRDLLKQTIPLEEISYQITELDRRLYGLELEERSELESSEQNLAESQEGMDRLETDLVEAYKRLHALVQEARSQVENSVLTER